MKYKQINTLSGYPLDDVLRDLVQQVNFLTMEIALLQDNEKEDEALREKSTPLREAWETYQFTKIMVKDHSRGE